MGERTHGEPALATEDEVERAPEANTAGLVPVPHALQPPGPLSHGMIGSLQRGVGNAAVSRLIADRRHPPGVSSATSAQLSREPAASPPAQHQSLTAADRERLEAAKARIDHAKTAKDTALDALSKYSDQSPKHLATLKTDADKNLERYKAAANQVNYIIGEANEIAKIQEEVITEIVGAALGGIGLVVAKLGHEVEAVYEKYKEIWERAKEGLEEFKLPEIAGAAKKGVVGEGESAAAAVGDPAAQELDFYKSFSELQGKSAQVLGVGVTVGKIAEPIGRVDEAIAGLLNTGVTRTDYPIATIDKDAATLEMVTGGLAKEADGVMQLIAELKAAVDQSKASAPKDDKEVEKALWKHWAAELGHGTDFKKLDADYLEKYLTRLGIWKELGIDIGSWFSSDEQIMAVGSARAQELVTAKKESVEFEPAKFGFSTVQLTGLPGNPRIPARLDSSGTVFTGKVRAVVVGAETVAPEGSLDTELLKQTARGPDGEFSRDRIAEYLLRNQYIRAVLRSYEDLSTKSDGGDGEAG